MKLASELARPDTGQTLYLLDEPTTGLHFDDLVKLLDVLHRLVDLGNTVVVIEHNLDVIKQADWIIDVGPEAGKHGGTIVCSGTPEEIADFGLRNADSNDAEPRPSASDRKTKKAKQALTAEHGTPKSDSAIRNPKSAIPSSHTADALRPVLAEGPHKKRKVYRPHDDEQEGDLDLDQRRRGRSKMPWEADGRRWHTRDRVARDGSDDQWDGRIVDQVERRIQELGDFAPTNWNNRSVVEITGHKKSDGWFFHALTGETVAREAQVPHRKADVQPRHAVGRARPAAAQRPGRHRGVRLGRRG